MAKNLAAPQKLPWIWDSAAIETGWKEGGTDENDDEDWICGSPPRSTSTNDNSCVGKSLQPSLPPCGDTDGGVAAAGIVAGHRQFCGLAEMPLERLQTMLCRKQFFDNNLDKAEEGTMKLRSILRFTTEYHNALLVRSAQEFHVAAGGRTPALLLFLGAANRCFQVICEIVTPSDNNFGHSADQHRKDFIEAFCELKSHCSEAGEQLSSYGSSRQRQQMNLYRGTLEQALGAVVGQMEDFQNWLLEVSPPTRQKNETT